MALDQQAQLAGPARPLGDPEIPQFHLPASAKSGVFRPFLYGAASIHFADRRRKIDETRRVAFMVPLEPTTRTVDWDGARPVEIMPDRLLDRAPREASYLPLPAGAMQVNTITRWAKRFDRWLARTQRLDLAASGASSAPGASPDASAPATLRPKRGGVSVEIVAIVWELS